MILIVMGVTGCGKTTLARALAEATGLGIHDADDYHTPSNREKLRNDIPLNDEDRYPWLEAMAKLMPQWEEGGGGVLACSALKKKYRDILRTGSCDVRFVYIRADRTAMADRLKKRALEGHILVRDYDRILEGQYRDLEEPCASVTVSHTLAPAQATREVLKILGCINLIDQVDQQSLT